MKKSANIPLLILLILMSLLLNSCTKKERQDLLFFYLESCPSCDEYILAETFNEKLVLLDKKGHWNTSFYNLITKEAALELKTVLSEKELPDISRSLPLLIIGNEYINGYDNIGEKLEEILLDAGLSEK